MRRTGDRIVTNIKTPTVRTTTTTTTRNPRPIVFAIRVTELLVSREEFDSLIFAVTTTTTTTTTT